MRPPLLALLLTLTACATPDTTPPADAPPEPPPEAAAVDVPARVEVACTPSACSCAGGAAGMRACLPNGELDACRCSAPPLDAMVKPVPTDATVDVATQDTRPEDATLDSGACACTLPHATPHCSNPCSIARCDPAFADCDGVASNGCETSMANDPRHCGGCDQACSFPRATAVCMVNHCALGVCEAGFANCDGNETNGCETPLNTLAHCGACDNACAARPHASSVCRDGLCFLGTCDPGFVNCNSDPNDGCESNPLTDAENCGRCGNRCGAIGQTCRDGRCS